MKHLSITALAFLLLSSAPAAEQIFYDDVRLNGQLIGTDFEFSTNNTSSLLRIPVWSEPSLPFGSNYIGVLPSYAGAILTNVIRGSVAPAIFRVFWTTDNLSWHSYYTNVPVAACIFSFGKDAQANDILSNAVIYGFDFADRFHKTNDLRFQETYVDDPSLAYEAASKRYTDNTAAGAVSAWSAWPATNTIYADQHPIAIDSTWDLLSAVEDTNTFCNLRFLGTPVLSVSAPAIGSGLITNAYATDDWITIHVLTNELDGPIAPEISPSLVLPTWTNPSGWTSSYPAVVDGCYVLGYPRTVTNAFVRVRLAEQPVLQLNCGFAIPSNSVSAWPAHPRAAGDAYFGSSNGVIYILTSVGSDSWTATNKLAP